MIADSYDPAEHTVNEVLEYVDANPDEAQAVLDAERDGQNRSTLVSQLESRVGQADEGEEAEGEEEAEEGDSVELTDSEGNLVSRIGGSPESVRQAAGTLADEPDDEEEDLRR